MESQFVVFVLFAIVTQSSLAQLSSSESQSGIEADFATIQYGKETTLARFHTAFDSTFDIITKFVNVDFGNRKQTTKVLSTTEVINENILNAFLEAHVASLAAIAVIQPDPAADTTDWDAEAVKAGEVVNGTYSAILLSKTSSGTLAQIEEIESEVSTKIVEIFAVLYDAMKIGRSDQPAVVAAIMASRAKALSSVKTAYCAIFDAIKILCKYNASKGSAGSKDIFSAIEFLRNSVSSVTTNEVWNKYALLDTVLIFSLVEDSEIANNYSVIQSAEASTLAGYSTTFEPIFSILYGIREIPNISVATEAAKDQVFTGLKETFIATKAAIQIIQTEDSPAIAIDDSAVDEVLILVTEGILNAVVLSQSKHSSGNLAEIQSNEEAVISAVISFYTTLYQTISSVSSPQAVVAAAIRSVQEQTISDLVIAFRTVFSMIETITVQNPSNTRSKNIDNFFLAIKIAQNEVFYRLKNEVGLKYALLRNLFIFNSLNENEIVVDYSVAVIA